MGRKTCKSSRKHVLSYSPLIFPNLILVIFLHQRFHAMSWDLWEQPEPERQASLRAKCWQPWGAQVLAQSKCAGDSTWILGCHCWSCVPQTLGIRKVAASVSCAPERSLISDPHIWKRDRIHLPSDADFHLTVKPPTFIPSWEGRFSFAQSPFRVSSPDVFLILSKTAKDSVPASGKVMVSSSSLEVHWEQSQATNNVLQQERSSPVGSSWQHGHVW